MLQFANAGFRSIVIQFLYQNRDFESILLVVK